MMATLHHVTSGLGLRKFQVTRFLLDRMQSSEPHLKVFFLIFIWFSNINHHTRHFTSILTVAHAAITFTSFARNASRTSADWPKWSQAASSLEMSHTYTHTCICTVYYHSSFLRTFYTWLNANTAFTPIIYQTPKTPIGLKI